MKRTFRIWVSIIVIVAIIAIASISYFFIKRNSRKYEIAQISNYEYFTLKKNDNYGVIDKNQNIVVEPNYTEIKIPNPEKAVFACYQNNEIKFFNNQKEQLFTQYEKVEPIKLKNIASDLMYEKTILKYMENGKYGLIDYEGKKVTQAIYEELDSLPYKEGELLVKKEGKYGVINIRGNTMVETKYDQVIVDGYYTDKDQYKYSGYIVSNTTEEGYRYGYVDYNGKEILEPQYNELERIVEIEENENAYLIAAKNGQYGLIKNDENIINNEYQSIMYDAKNKVFVIEKSKKYGISKLDGKIIVPVEYEQIDITGIYLYAQNNQGTTVYNSNGTEANIDADIAILDTTNERYRIRIDNKEGTKYGIIDKEGKQLVEEKYDYIVRKLQEQGKIIDTVLMTGFPTETEEDLEKTINYIKERKIYVEGISGYEDFYAIPSHELEQLSNSEKRRHLMIASKAIQKSNYEVLESTMDYPLTNKSVVIGHNDKRVYLANSMTHYSIKKDLYELPLGTIVEEQFQLFFCKFRQRCNMPKTGKRHSKTNHKHRYSCQQNLR